MLLDSNGNPVENAVVEVHSKVRTGITDENGIFGITGVEVGNHELTVKNLSNEVIATDSITLTGGQTETISNKDIVGDTNNSTINMKIKLGESTNIDTINTWSYVELCTIDHDSLGCRLYESIIRIIINLNGGTLDTILKSKYNENSNVFVGYPYKDGYAFSGWTVSGTGATMENGTLKLGSTSATLTANYMALADIYTYTGNSTIIDDGNGNWRIKFLTSGTFTPSFNMEIDAFLVGGGGGGGSGAGGGGGGGYTTTNKGLSLTAYTEYSITIGSGGIKGMYDGAGSNGGTTTGFGYSALGGYAGGGWNSSSKCKGGNGGSGGGGGTGGTGGNDGNDGTVGTPGSFGIGQGLTTREFGEITGDLYGSGGNGGSSGVGSSATSNTGDGGCGGGGGSPYNGGDGGSGIVVIRPSN
jgi:uncharacterized repeat protein (TIGR02543 family)